MNHIIFPKSEPAISRGVEKNCLVCRKKFSVLIREHQCKRCLKAVCSDCGNFQCNIFSSAVPKKQVHRVCKACKDSSEYIIALIKNNNLKFGEMSDIGRQWFKKIVKKSVPSGTDDFQHKLLTKEVFGQLWTSYSFELRELIGLLTSQFEQSGIYDLVFSVFKTVSSVAKGIMITKIMHLIMFVLCFCQSDKAIIIVLYLIQLRQEQKDLKNIAFNFVKALPYQTEYQKIENYAHYRFQKYIDSFFVNGSTMECCVVFMGETFKKRSLEQIFMFFSSHLYINRQTLYLKAVQSPRDLLDQMVLRNCSQLEITSFYKQIKNKNIQLKNGIQNSNEGFKKVQSIGFKSKQNIRESPTFESNSPIESSLGPQLLRKQQKEQNSPIFQDSFTICVEGSGENSKQQTFQSNDHSKRVLPLDILSQQADSIFKKILSEEGMGANEGNAIAFRKNSTCGRCEYYQEESQKYKSRFLQLQKEKQQLEIIKNDQTAKIHLYLKQNQQLEKKVLVASSEQINIKKALDKSIQELKEVKVFSVKCSQNLQESKKKLEETKAQLIIQIQKRNSIKEAVQKEQKSNNFQIEYKKIIQVNEKQNKQFQKLKTDNNQLTKALKGLSKEKDLMLQKYGNLQKQYKTCQGNIKKLVRQKEIVQGQLNFCQIQKLSLQTTSIESLDKKKQLQQENNQIKIKLEDTLRNNKKGREELQQLNSIIDQYKGQIAELKSQLLLSKSSNNSNSGANNQLIEYANQVKNDASKLRNNNIQLQARIAKMQSSFEEISADLREKAEQICSLGKEKLMSQRANKILEEENIKIKEQMVGLDLKMKELTSLFEQKTANNQNLQRDLQLLRIQSTQQQTKSNEKLVLLQHQHQKQIDQKIRQIEILRSSERLQQSKRKQSFQEVQSMSKQLELCKKELQQLRTQNQSYLVNNQKINLQLLTLEEQLRTMKILLQKSKKQNQELKIGLSLAEKMLSEKQSQIRSLSTSSAKSNSFAESIAMQKLKEAQGKNEELRRAVKEGERQTKDLFSKLNELSSLMMQMEGEKLDLAEQNFAYKQLLIQHKINV